MKSAAVVLVLCSFGLAACYTTTIEPAPDTERRQLLDDLQLTALGQGIPVSRSEIEHRLGVPSASFEGGRIVVYALRKMRGHFEQPREASTIGLDYRLVLVYQRDGTVERWSLVDRNQW